MQHDCRVQALVADRFFPGAYTLLCNMCVVYVDWCALVLGTLFGDEVVKLGSVPSDMEVVTLIVVHVQQVGSVT